VSRTPSSAAAAKSEMVSTRSTAARTSPRWGADRSDDLHAHLDRAFTDLRLAANALK
jgi:hypothetical protein